MNLAAVYDRKQRHTPHAKELAMHPKASPVLDVGVLRDAASMVEANTGVTLYDAVLAQPSPDSPTWAAICDMGRFEALSTDRVETLAALGNSKIVEQVYGPNWENVQDLLGRLFFADPSEAFEPIAGSAIVGAAAAYHAALGSADATRFVHARNAEAADTTLGTSSLTRGCGESARTPR